MYNENMKKKKPNLNIAGYADNAARNFSYKRLIIYTIISLVLTILLIVSAVKAKYTGRALIFTSIVIVIIAGYTTLNIVALIKKSQNDKA